jgi:hypothetical protein
VYGNTTQYSNGRTSFTEYESDDLAEVKTEFLKLDKIYGYENLKVIAELDFSIDVDIFENDKLPTAPSSKEEETGKEDSSDSTNETKNETGETDNETEKVADQEQS